MYSGNTGLRFVVCAWGGGGLTYNPVRTGPIVGLHSYINMYNVLACTMYSIHMYCRESILKLGGYSGVQREFFNIVNIHEHADTYATTITLTCVHVHLSKFGINDK